MAGLTTTESVLVDLYALRAWHFRASLDRDRSPEMRRWHRSQVDAVNKRLAGMSQTVRDQVKLGLLTVLAEQYRKQLQERAKSLAPFAWEKFCAAARKQIDDHELR